MQVYSDHYLFFSGPDRKNPMVVVLSNQVIDPSHAE